MKSTIALTTFLLLSISLTGCAMMWDLLDVADALIHYTHEGTALSILDLGNDIQIITFKSGRSMIFWNPVHYNIPMLSKVRIFYDSLKDYELRDVELPLEGRWMIDGKIIGVKYVLE